MEPTEVQRRTLERFADAVASLAEEGRLEFLALLRERFCPHCGEDQPLHGVCQCTNDE